MSSLKGAKDILEAMKDLRDAASLQSKVLELQSRILDAQSAAFDAQDTRATLIQKVSELEKEVADLEAWSREKERYELKAIGHNAVLAYAAKDDMRGDEPPHWICASCYQQSKKSMLQPETRFPGQVEVYICNACGAEIIPNGARQAEWGTPQRSRKPSR